MKSSIKSAKGLLRELEIEVPVDLVDAAFAEAYHKYRKDAQIKGFRPGKAPLAVIKSKFNDDIREDVLSELIKKSYPLAVKEQNLHVASYPALGDYTLNEGEPLRYVAHVEVMPEILNVKYDGLKLPVDEIQVFDSEVDAVVDYLRKKHAEIRPVSRPAQANDILVVDLVKLEDPSNILKGNEFKGNEIDLSSSLTVKEFRDSMVGLNAGEEKEVTVNYPPDYSDERFSGKTLKYRCLVKEVREKILPEPNDSFAKTVGGVETILELRLKIREDLKKQKETEQEKWKKNELTRQMIDLNPFDVPEAMVQNYLDGMVEDFSKNYKNFDEKQVREQYRPVAVNSIKWHLLSSRLAELEKIEVLPIDTENWIKRFADNYQMDVARAKEVLSNSGRIQEIRDSILEEKILEFLLSKVSFVSLDTFKAALGGESQPAASSLTIAGDEENEL